MAYRLSVRSNLSLVNGDGFHSIRPGSNQQLYRFGTDRGARALLEIHDLHSGYDLKSVRLALLLTNFTNFTKLSAV
jgi:hypothetical protein